MRKFLLAGIAIASLLTSCCCNKNADEQRLFIGEDIAIAQTEFGQVRGYILDDTYTFLGIPYGASTEGENRFLPPQKPQAWEGIRNTVFYGNVAPQNTDNKYGNNFGTFSDHWNYYDVSEDCLTLNVWTPQTDSEKRPVLVWFHGGGWTSGNGIEQDGYNGANISREGDIVFVSVNHRLGAIGFTDFSLVDPKYVSSGNAGALDMVAALQWVHNNIQNFGGDPSNVTIMGQSGGGSKVCTLVNMPETEGLISKGVALSGNTVSAGNKEATQALGLYIYEKAGKDMSKILAMSWKEYIAFANECSREFSAKTGLRAGFSPVADGIRIPEGTFFSNPEAASSKVPMIFCTATAEHPIAFTSPELTEMTWDDAAEYVASSLNVPDANATIEAYRGIFPDKEPFQVVDLISSSRDGVLRAANAKSSQEAPVYLAWFNYNSPLFDARRGSFHCMDICFWFKNTDKMITHTGGGKEPREISNLMSSALLNFMRTGNPNGKGIPQWPEYNEEECPTMIFDVETKVVNNPDTEARKTLK